MADDDFHTLLDGVDTQKTKVLDICKNYNKQEPSPSITDQQFNEHPFFTKHFSKEFGIVLEHWFSDGTLDENQRESFQIYSKFLYKLTKKDPNAKQWLNQQTEIIDLTDKCLNEIASYGYYVGIGSSEDPNLEAFDWLIQAFENIRCQQLLLMLVRCVTSRFYVDALYRLNDVDALSFTVTQHFLLVTCPNYILMCDKEKTFCLTILNQMLNQYREIFADFLPHIKQWTIPVILSLIYPIKFVSTNIRTLSLAQKKFVYEINLTILLNKTTDLSTEQGRITLIHTSLCLLIEIVRSDKNLSNQLKNETDEKSDLIDILNDLSKNDANNSIKLRALELLSLLLPEKEFLKEENTEKVTGLFVKNLTEALADGDDNKADEVLSGLKDLVQSDEVKQEIMKQNGLPSILKYAKATTDNPLPLQITYAMTFNGDAKKVINQDTDFVDHVKKLRESEAKAISQVAHGIIWKLEGEEKFKNEEEQKDKTAEISDEAVQKYDMMISYCWAQKPLCHKINDRLEKEGYKVWLDRDEMHGSIIESMAEAIENSRFVLLCMSSNYKNSINCKAEAEYAFNRKSKIIPLVVETKYQADGWLGFLAGSKIYVDFADKDETDEEFDQAYQLLIAELERNGLNEPDEEKSANGTSATTTETKSKPEEVEKEPEIPPIETREYLNIASASSWNDTHVSEFLTENKLEQLIPICQSMDGETLLEFHQACQTIPDKMYGLIKNPKDEPPLSLATFYKFIARLKKHIPPKPTQKVHFQYNYIYPSSYTITPPAEKENS